MLLFLFFRTDAVKEAAEQPLWLADGSASGKALTNCFCCYDCCLKRLGRFGLAISGQSFVNLFRSNAKHSACGKRGQNSVR
jgi:hypothetical protein